MRVHKNWFKVAFKFFKGVVTVILTNATDITSGKKKRNTYFEVFETILFITLIIYSNTV